MRILTVGYSEGFEQGCCVKIALRLAEINLQNLDGLSDDEDLVKYLMD